MILILVHFIVTQIADRNKKLFVKPSNVDFTPRSKTKGKGGTAKQFHVKRTVQEEERRVRDSYILTYLAPLLILLFDEVK